MKWKADESKQSVLFNKSLEQFSQRLQAALQHFPVRSQRWNMTMWPPGWGFTITIPPEPSVCVTHNTSFWTTSTIKFNALIPEPAHIIGTSSHTYYSQVDAELLVRKIERLNYSGLSDGASACAHVIPTLRLRHLPQLMQHKHQTHSWTRPHGDDIWNNLLIYSLGG